GRADGPPPPVDLDHEKRVGDHVRSLIASGIVTAAHDVSDGGLAIALAEMAMASGIGAQLDAAPSDIPAHAHWFGEDQARYLITVPAPQVDAVLARARAANVPVWMIGRTGGDTLTLPGERPILVTILRECFESWLPAYMAGEL
ncbi:MAG TPA: AIR synthase-related protein, partial [Pseudolabrys sp.]